MIEIIVICVVIAVPIAMLWAKGMDYSDSEEDFP